MLNLDKLNKEQREAAEYINGALLILAGAGTGKSLLNGSGVLTANGYVPIETLHIGDKVYGRDGELHNVIGVFPQGQKEIGNGPRGSFLAFIWDRKRPGGSCTERRQYFHIGVWCV